MKNTVLLIINPKAGHGIIKTKINDIINFYINNNYLPTIYFTQKKNDVQNCINFITKNKQHFNLISCFGGDGSLSETITALINSNLKTKLSYIPCGSTNDNSYNFNIPNDINKALKISVANKTKAIDVGCFNDKHFLYVAAFGMFTNLSYEVSQDLKNIFGYLAYVLQGFTLLNNIKTYKINATFNKTKYEADVLAGLILNTLHVAGMTNPVSKQTKINDGKFEILLIKKPNNLLELHELISYLLGNIKNTNLVTFAQTDNVTINSKDLKWTLDGENGGKVDIAKITVLNKIINMITG